MRDGSLSGATIWVNGSPLDSSKARLERVLEEMRRQGWGIESISVDGEPVPTDGPFTAATDSPRVEIAATPPAGPGEPDASRESLFRQLGAAAPAFRSEAELLGLAFARGEWRASLERLSRYLGDVEAAQAGFRALSDLNPNVVPRIDRMTPMLRELSQAIRDQSWVEVSDVLLYEVAPLFDDWPAENTSPETTPGT